MSETEDVNRLSVGIAQISPVWLNRQRTLDKIIEHVSAAAGQGCRLVVFGEALLPGYPFWIELTDGARFNSPIQKEIHAHYLQNAVQIEAGHLDPLCETAGHHGIVVVLGCIERASDRGWAQHICFSRLYRRRWRHMQCSSQTHADIRRAPDLGSGRRSRTPGSSPAAIYSGSA